MKHLLLLITFLSSPSALAQDYFWYYFSSDSEQLGHVLHGYEIGPLWGAHGHVAMAVKMNPEKFDKNGWLIKKGVWAKLPIPKTPGWAVPKEIAGKLRYADGFQPQRHFTQNMPMQTQNMKKAEKLDSPVVHKVPNTSKVVKPPKIKVPNTSKVAKAPKTNKVAKPSKIKVPNTSKVVKPPIVSVEQDQTQENLEARSLIEVELFDQSVAQAAYDERDRNNKAPMRGLAFIHIKPFNSFGDFRWGHDPFLKPPGIRVFEKEPEMKDPVLSEIIYDPEYPSAVINEDVVYEGSVTRSGSVIKIGRDFVLLKAGSQVKQLMLKNSVNSGKRIEIWEEK